MERIIGLDIGTKRVGVALSDQSGLIATPLATFERGSGKAEAQVLKIIEENSIKTVVAGLPTTADGRETESAEAVRKFCTRLKRRAEIEVTFVDEYLSTEEAKQRLSVSPSKAQELRSSGLIDAHAASIILQAFLDR